MSYKNLTVHPIPTPRPMAWPRTPVNLEAIGYSAQNVRDRHGTAFTQRAVFPHLGEEMLICVINSMDPEDGLFGERDPVWMHPGAFCGFYVEIRSEHGNYRFTVGDTGEFDDLSVSSLAATCPWERVAPLFQQDHVHVIATAAYPPLLPHQVHDADPRPVRAFEIALDADDLMIRSARAGDFVGSRVQLHVCVARRLEGPFASPPGLSGFGSDPEDEAWRRESMARIWRIHDFDECLPALTRPDKTPDQEKLYLLGDAIEWRSGQEGKELAAKAIAQHPDYGPAWWPALLHCWGIPREYPADKDHRRYEFPDLRKESTGDI